MSSTPTHHLLPGLPAQQEALNLEVKSNNGREASSLREAREAMSMEASARAAMEAVASRMLKEESLNMPAAKRFMSETELAERYILNAGIPSAHIKISSRGTSDGLRRRLRQRATPLTPPAGLFVGMRLFCPARLLIRYAYFYFFLPRNVNTDGRTQLENGSLVVSMEINGIIYQGVLFAQTASHRTRLS